MEDFVNTLILRVNENGILQHIEDLSSFMFDLMNNKRHDSAALSANSCDRHDETLVDVASLSFVWYGYVIAMLLASAVFGGEHIMFEIIKRYSTIV